tara:strand:- start:19184 stop:19471 length:288 start_codon:yes stop_codon:yes gene_type:complete
MTYPAPIFLSYDEWFGEPILTETQIEYQNYMKEPIDDIIVNMDGGVGGSWTVSTKESENIHQVMYEIATENAPTTLELNPLPTLGGSEVWMSGRG